MSRRFEEADNRPVFVGNLDPYTTQREIERLFDRKGRIKRVEMKTGFAFVFYEDHRDARDAVKDYDGYEFGPSRRRLRVELARGDGLIKRREDDRRTEARNNPCETLFVVNFDPTKTRTKDLEKLFEEYGTLIRVEIKKNFAFVQFQTTEEATAAMRALDGHYVADRQITVEFMVFIPDNRGSYCCDEGTGRSLCRRSSDHSGVHGSWKHEALSESDAVSTKEPSTSSPEFISIPSQPAEPTWPLPLPLSVTAASCDFEF
eukprot:CAMPEP_0196666746 /NCGR_PEP_ID=MMETSP1086-20130531/64689_1 /TAXON_ID=77921 /ORGANISM="Cyanoptyche  gloeocystis , Strain SAG4.97" /LENGTH=259 /DNA_ID=CAMNT_0042003983 /DNA_START=84 /DNA_END=864 /DNA_ORIENTATION=+